MIISNCMYISRVPRLARLQTLNPPLFDLSSGFIVLGATMSQDQRACSLEEKWSSKLGNKYSKRKIEANHERNMALLARMRREPANRICAECGQEGTVWSSVNLGVFTCMRCGSLHRALGTHISKPKGCTGTYLW